VADVPEGSPAVAVTSAGAVTTGGVVSTTLTLNVADEDVLFDASVAVQETVVVPSGNVSPEVRLQLTVGEGSMVSFALTEKGTLAPAGAVASAVTGPGTDTVGGVPSTRLTVTVKVAVPTLVPSLAEQVTVVVPTAKFEPEAGEQFAGGEPATASVAEAEP
jgi:hypothetical protein